MEEDTKDEDEYWLGLVNDVVPGDFRNLSSSFNRLKKNLDYFAKKYTNAFADKVG